MPAILMVVLLGAAAVPGSASESTPGQGEPLASAAAVRELLPAQAEAGVPVRLRGVVTYFRDPRIPDFVLQDGSGGVHVHQLAAAGHAVMVEPGDEVEIEGRTDATVYAPRVGASRVMRLGRQPLPEPARASVEELRAGYHEGSLVEVAAVVRAASIDRTIDPPRLVLTLGSPSGQIDALVTRFADDDAARLVDAGVRLRGVPLRLQNRRNEPFRWIIFTHRIADLVVDEAPPAEPFAASERALGEILASGPQQSRHRMRVRGVATYARGELLVLQERSSGLRVRLAAGTPPTPVAVGDAVEASGFARLGDYNPLLEEAVVRVTGHPGAPPPEDLPLASLHDATRDARALAARDGCVVRLAGTVEELGRRDGWLELDLRADGRRVPVRLPAEGAIPATIAVGSEVRATGICEVQPGTGVVLLSRSPSALSLLLPDASGLTVLRSAPWWTVGRLVVVLLSVAAGLGLAVAWALTLRRRVAQRSRQLEREILARREAELEFSTVIAERRRIAAEIHDTVEQGLTGVALQLEAATLGLTRAASQPPPQLALARQLLDHSRAEVRRSVWDLNAQAGEERDFPGMVRAIADQARIGRETAVRTEISGEAVPLPGVTAHHLARIVQEALHNAVRHGRAREVAIAIGFSATTVTVAVRDDGGGFEPASAAASDTGHFGLQIMRERARRLGGTLEIASTPGTGARIVAAVPIAAAQGGT